MDAGADVDASRAEDADAAHPEGGAREDGGDTRDAADVDAAPPDDTPPHLVESTPRDGDDNVAFDTPLLRLVFSERVVLGAGAIVLHQAAPERVLAIEVTQSQDGRNVDISLGAAPQLPAQLTLALGADITDLAGNPFESLELRFALPVWLRLGAEVDRDPAAEANDVRIALDAEGRTVILSVEGDALYASRWEDGAWQMLGSALNQRPTLASAASEPRMALAIDATSAPLVAFRESTGVSVVRWDGSTWQNIGDGLDPDGGGTHAPALAFGAAGEPVVAFDALDASIQPRLRVRALESATWQTLEDISAQVRGVRLANVAGSGFRLAYQETGVGIVALRWDDGAGLVPLGSTATLLSGSGSFALSAASADTTALTAQGQGTVVCAADECSMLPHDLGFVNGSAALDRALAHAPEGALSGAFAEIAPGETASRVYVQRLVADGFQPLGPALNRNREAQATRPAIAIDAAGRPVVAHIESAAGSGGAQLFAARYNGDPEAPPYGLRERGFDAECLATVPLDGSQLTATGCFSDTLGREPTFGFIPFDVRSPLWSDGAFKRRFVMLPEGTNIAYRDPGIWTLPEGAILIKEFSIEARRGDPGTLRPVETRFLVVRDNGTWDRYSYEWNQDATAAVLRTASPASDRVSFAVEDETGAASSRVHYYPTRSFCLQCHETPGTVLGLQTAMMNRNLDYGDSVDNQLRTLQQLGVFADSFAQDALPLARTMANPSDPTYSTESRLRAYLHANCSSCHHPLFGLDLRIQASTPDSGLCDKITRGNLDGSVIYWRDVLREDPGLPGTPSPMPPVGTLVPNPELETLLTDWILDPQNACP